MTTFSGPEVVIDNLSAEEFFNKLSDLNNLKQIMPPEIKNFESDANNCSFKMKGMPELKLKISEKIPFAIRKLSIAAGQPQYTAA